MRHQKNQQMSDESTKNPIQEAEIAELACDYFDSVNKGQPLEKERIVGKCSSERVVEKVLSLCEFIDLLAAVRDVKEEENPR